MSKTDELLNNKARRDSIAHAESVRKDSIEQAQAKYQANYEKLGIDDLKKELKKKQDKFNELAKVIDIDPKEDQEKAKTKTKYLTIGGTILGAIGGERLTTLFRNADDAILFHERCNFLDLLMNRKFNYTYHCYINLCHEKQLKYLKQAGLGIVGIAALGAGITYGLSKLLFKPETEETKQQKIQQMRELEPQIQELEQRIKTLEAQC
ncbi:MAG: hypothetical protein MJ237_08910 [bacterium]|nr:hypothetical protein [bacterium]